MVVRERFDFKLYHVLSLHNKEVKKCGVVEKE